MTTYRTGNHHGVTIVAEPGSDDFCCNRDGHDHARGRLVAVVVDGGQALAERICALLNGGGTIAALDQAATDMRKGYPGHGHPIEYVNGWEDAAAFAEGHAAATGPATRLISPQAAVDPSGVGPVGVDDLSAPEDRCAIKPDPGCPIHQGRRPRGPKPPPVGLGCICDGSGRTCPRHGAVI